MPSRLLLAAALPAGVLAACAFQGLPVAGATDGAPADAPWAGDGPDAATAADARDASTTDSRTADAPPDAVTLGPFGPAALVVDLDTTGIEATHTLTGDTLEIFFTRGGDLWTASRAAPGQPWSAPAPVTAVNSASSETTAEVADDGLTLWFASDRPGGAGMTDIYVSLRAARGAPWGVPVRVVELCSANADWSATPGAGGLTMVVVSDRPGMGSNDLYWTARPSAGTPWAPPAPLDAVNTPSADGDPWLDATGTVLYFSSDRPGGLGGRDLWRAVRPDVASPFGAPAPVAELNTVAADRNPWLSPDQRTIWFSSDRSGAWKLYVATR